MEWYWVAWWAVVTPLMGFCLVICVAAAIELVKDL